MKTFKILLILVLIFLIFSRNSITKQLIKKTSQGKPTTIKVETKTPTPILTVTGIQNNTTPTEEVKQTQPTTDNAWVYPNSKQIGSLDNTLLLESNDDPGKITDWYKQKIESMGMSAKSFVQTKTNDNVLNKLVAANGKEKIDIEINKKAGEQVVRIKVLVVNLN